MVSESDGELVPAVNCNSQQTRTRSIPRVEHADKLKCAETASLTHPDGRNSIITPGSRPNLYNATTSIHFSESSHAMSH